MTAASLTAERRRLERLAVDVDVQLAAVEAALRIYTPKAGRPRLPFTMTYREATDAHNAYNGGDRSAWAVTGNREYQRRWARRRRAA